MPDRRARVLRIAPRFDWRSVPEAGDVAGRDAIGGLAVQVRRLTDGVAALGTDQLVLTARPSGAPRRARTAAGATVLAVGPAGVPGVHRAAVAWLAGVARALVALRRRRPDVVHVHASGLAEPLAAAVLARVLLRRPVVLTLHCSARATYRVRSRRDAAVQVVTRALERAAVLAAARTLVLTERVRGELGDRATVAPDVVETVNPRPARRVPDRPAVAYVGRIAAEKGWPALVEVAVALPRARVVVVGDGPDRPALERAAAARGVEDRVRVTGAVAPDAVPAALASADVLVLPSEHEELGSVLLEAMALGLPSVAYAVGGVPEAVVPGRTGLLVAPGDVAALVAAVDRALGDDELRARVASEGPARAAERHGVAAAARQLQKLYANVATP